MKCGNAFSKSNLIKKVIITFIVLTKMATIKVLWEIVTGHLTQQWGEIPGVTGWMTKQDCQDLNPTEPSVFLFLCLSKTIH